MKKEASRARPVPTLTRKIRERSDWFYDEATMARRDDVRLNEMSSLFDLGLFPAAVCAGAVANVLLTILVTRLVRHSGWPIGLPAWLAIVLAANLLPVVILRALTLQRRTHYRPVREMSFFGDQHKFPIWVYALASFNMAVWVSASWAVFGQPDNPQLHLLLIAAALLVTSFPLWVRLLRR